jgi:nicotinate-nucleotide pyrophosphorylase (carboxylating)
VAAKLKEEFPNVLIEASGGITFDTMVNYFSPAVDIISRGNLTQGYRCLDFSLKIQSAKS